MQHLIECQYLGNNNTTESFTGHEVPTQNHLNLSIQVIIQSKRKCAKPKFKLTFSFI